MKGKEILINSIGATFVTIFLVGLVGLIIFVITHPTMSGIKKIISFIGLVFGICLIYNLLIYIEEKNH